MVGFLVEVVTFYRIAKATFEHTYYAWELDCCVF